MSINISSLDLKKYVSDACKEKGISFRKLGFLINMSDIGLAKTLNNKTVKLSTLIDISNALEIDLTQLILGKLTGTGNKSLELIKSVQEENLTLKEEIKRLNEQLNDKRQIIDLIQQNKIGFFVKKGEGKYLDYNIDIEDLDSLLTEFEKPNPEKEKIDELILRIKKSKNK